jgi:hypothetical protein
MPKILRVLMTAIPRLHSDMEGSNVRRGQALGDFMALLSLSSADVDPRTPAWCDGGDTFVPDW